MIRLADGALDAIRGAAALVVATDWPEFRNVDPELVASSMAGGIVIDPGGFLEASLGGSNRLKYVRVGRACP